MTFKSGVFTSHSVCTQADLELERAINGKLKAGRITCYTIDMAPPRYGICFTYRGMSKVHERTVFDVDHDELLEGLKITAEGMQNARLAANWTTNADDIVDMPAWLEDIIDAAL